MKISWDEIDRVQAGATNAPNAPKVFVSLRTRRPEKRSWIITILRAEDAEFLPMLLARANEARGLQGGEPLQAQNPYDSAGWKFAAIFLLVMFLAAIIGTIVAGKADDLYVWARVFTLGAFSIPLAKQVLFSKTKETGGSLKPAYCHSNFPAWRWPTRPMVLASARSWVTRTIATPVSRLI